MRLIVGLGNPGKRYETTRHNVGFFVLDKLALELGVESWELSKKYKSLITNHQSLILSKPQTFMNESGVSVKYVRDKHKIAPNNIFVVFDDLDIPLGEYKIQKGKGPKNHNGLNSIYEVLGAKDFWHVRVGVNNPDTRKTENGERIAGENYVLMKFTDGELTTLNSLIGEIESALLSKVS